jgi:hypothetical protein
MGVERRRPADWFVVSPCPSQLPFHYFIKREAAESDELARRESDSELKEWRREEEEMMARSSFSLRLFNVSVPVGRKRVHSKVDERKRKKRTLVE